MRHFCQGIGRCGSDEITVGPLAESYMGVPCAVLGVEELDENRIFRERSHGQGRDELFRQGCHHDLYVSSGRLQ